MNDNDNFLLKLNPTKMVSICFFIFFWIIYHMENGKSPAIPKIIAIGIIKPFGEETARWKLSQNTFQPRASGEAMAAGFKAISYQYITSLIAGLSLKVHGSDLR